MPMTARRALPAGAGPLTRRFGSARVEDVHTAIYSGGGADDEGAQAAMGSWRGRVPPDNEIASIVALDTVLTRSDDVAFTLRSLRVFQNGVLLDVVVQHRIDDDPAVGGGPRFPFDGGVLVGVELADGSTATASQGGPWDGGGSGAPGGPTLQHQGGGGGGRMYEIAYWLTPVPTGDLIVVAASVPHHLPEGRVVVPGDVIAEAASRVRVLWPREPDRKYEPDAARPPDVPAGGWFARVLGTG